MPQASELDFSDVQLQEILVTGPDGLKYILREANGADATRYKNLRNSRLIFNDKGMIAGMRDAHDLEGILIGMCLYDAEGKTKIKPTVFDAWSDRIKTKLFLKAQEISALKTSESDYGTLLVEALNHPDAPVKCEVLLAWLNDLEGEKFDPLRTLFETEAKN